MKLKRYQTETLAVLRRFLEEAHVAGPAGAYDAVTSESAQAHRLGRYRGSYRQLDELPGVPYVCLRLPTGGGKTVLAAHAVAVAREAWMDKSWFLVLWLVPTTIIRRQTAEALKNPRHSYRRILDDVFDGRVRVFDIGDFTNIRPHDLADHCCIVVGTIQSLRVTNTEGRKVYAHNEHMEPHFKHLSEIPTGLEKLENGDPKCSFANLLHLHRPLMIVDEAHNAVTGLTREMQARVNPKAIIEFTATPRMNSNILHSVTASELKAEEMIKLPVMLAEYDTWQNAVNGAVAARTSLAHAANADSDYLRPIVLFQAQQRNQEVTVEALKRHLVDVERIQDEKIAVATGNQRQLDGIDLFDPDSPIEFVITVEALKEGWDCSFAYVFCSVSRVQSAVDVEQLLGRVLRMPYAKRRKALELNRAYAFLSEPSFGEAAVALVDKLIAMGFEEGEAQESVEQIQHEFDGEENILKPRTNGKSVFRHTVTGTPKVAEKLRKHEGVVIQETASGQTEISVVGQVDEQLEREIAKILPKKERQNFSKAVARYRKTTWHVMTPAERKDEFGVPRLMSMVQGTLEFADTDVFMANHDWSLLDYSSILGEDQFTIRETARSFEIDIDGRRIRYQFASEEEQLTLEVGVEGWTQEALVIWLDRQVRVHNIQQKEMLRWLSDLVGHLIVNRDIHISTLMRCKFILARRVRERLACILRQVREGVYQQCLFGSDAVVEVSFDCPFEFREGMYQGERRYRGRWKPRRHFLGADQVPAFDGAENGEEFQCAQAIDSLACVKYWLRNIAKHPRSFWLPTSTDRFYPDFVVRMDDGRTLVVEYKGAHIAENRDTSEKRTVGELWERCGHGTNIFLVAEKAVNGMNVREQLMRKVSGR